MNRFAPYLVMPKSNQDSEKDVRVAGFNINLIKEITIPLFSVVMILIVVFMFVTGGDGLIFRICLETKTKKELKSLLTKYIGSENSRYAVSGAQHKIGIMNSRHDKAAEEMRKCNEEFAATRKSVKELETYKEIDKFNSIQYEKDLMKKSRLRYGDPDSIVKKEIYTSNDAI